MWPRFFELLPRLIDALPHVDRFSSVAERFLAARSSEDAALLSSNEGLRADLNHIGATHVSAITVLTHKLDELATEVAATAADAQASRSINVALGHSIVAIERQLRALRALLISLVILVVVLILMLGCLLITQSRP